jgi:hypothetical protein
MKRIKIFGLALVTMLALGAMATSGASAALEYLVGGALLGSGGLKLITASAEKPFILKGEAIGIKTTVECKKLKLNAGAEILGGDPGTSHETVIFEECVPTAPSECVGKKVKVENTPVNNELTMVVKPAAQAGKIATLFTPSSGSLFTTITFEGCVLNTQAKVTGNAAALSEPEKVDQLKGLLLFKEGAEEITEVEKSTGAKTKVELLFAGNKATLEGATLVALVSDELWGIF